MKNYATFNIQLKLFRCAVTMKLSITIICFFFFRFHHASATLIQRKDGLNTFTCRCIACEKNYPWFENLPSVNIPNFVRPDTFTHTATVNAFSDYLNKNARYYPCQQLISAEYSFQRYLELGFLQEVSMKSLIYILDRNVMC